MSARYEIPSCQTNKAQLTTAQFDDRHRMANTLYGTVCIITYNTTMCYVRRPSVIPRSKVNSLAFLAAKRPSHQVTWPIGLVCAGRRLFSVCHLFILIIIIIETGQFACITKHAQERVGNTNSLNFIRQPSEWGLVIPYGAHRPFYPGLQLFLGMGRPDLRETQEKHRKTQLGQITLADCASLVVALIKYGGGRAI